MRRLRPDFWRSRLPGALAMVTALGFTGLVGWSSEPVLGDPIGQFIQAPEFISLRIERADFCPVETDCPRPDISDVFTTYRIPGPMQRATLELLHESDECPNPAKRYAFGSSLRIAVQPSERGERRPACPLPDE